MYRRDLEKERTTLENPLKEGTLNFAATYMALGDLHSLVETYPGVAHFETVTAFKQVLKSPDFTSETQAFFLYKKAAEALTFLVTNTAGSPLAFHSLTTLQGLLGATKGHSHRASAEAIGSLPLSVGGPKIDGNITKEIPRITWREILDKEKIACRENTIVLGRSLVAYIDKTDSLLAVKLVSSEDYIESASREAAWMEKLRSNGHSFPLRFNIPKPIKVNGSSVFKLRKIPEDIFQTMGPTSDLYAIAFIAHKDYFAYPNDHRPGKQLCAEAFKEVIFRNAWLLGRLTSLGIVHCAPIPLFHNRVQRGRRPDRGLYEWQRAGRLDRWLQSCRYPNFGLTGIRDFEHIISFNGSSRQLYNRVGTQILSLLLTTGSYFRNKEPERVGFDKEGNAVDARDLFDKPFFKELVQGIFLAYYDGFTNMKFAGKIPLDFDDLICRMIDEMGVDHHMEEILRVVDQREMSDEFFKQFLKNRGYSDKDIKTEEKGVREITTYTGPHLGGFNERISIPELIDSVGTMSALCISGKFLSETLMTS